MNISYEEYLSAGTKKIDEYCLSEKASKGERAYIVNAFTDELMGSIGNTGKLKDSEQIILTASMCYLDQEISKIMAYRVRMTSDRNTAIDFCNRQQSLIDQFIAKKWPLPIKYTDKNNPQTIKSILEKEEAREQAEKERIERERKEREKREREERERAERERREKEKREREEKEKIERARRERAERQKREREERERIAEEERQAKIRKLKRTKRLKDLSVIAIIVFTAAVVLFFTVIKPQMRYNSAVQLINEKKYDQAAAIFEEMNGYQDSSVRLQQIKADRLYDQGKLNEAYIIYAKIGQKYNRHIEDFQKFYEQATELMKKEQYTEASELFLKLGDYKDSKSQSNECQYLYAVQLINAKKYDQAVTIFENLKSYKDSSVRLQQIKADKLYDQGKLDEAYTIYAKIGQKYNQHTEDYQKFYEQAAELMKNGKYTEASELFLKLGDYQDSKSQSVECRYLYARTLFDAEDYQKAKEIFKSLDKYKDSRTMVKESTYFEAAKLFKDGNYDDAEELYEELGKYKDSPTLLTDVRRTKADKLVEQGELDNALEIYESINDKQKIQDTKYLIGVEKMKITGGEREAISWLQEVGDYKDAKALIEENKKIYIRRMRNKTLFADGNTIIFGQYEQDGNLANGTEPIEWIVLRHNEDFNAIFVTTKYALDCRQYNIIRQDVTWEKSSVRTWLREDFLGKAFSAKEQEMIIETPVSNTRNDGRADFAASPGNSTKDKVYLLSYYEITMYFKTDEARKLMPTNYAISQHAHQPTCFWMTRSPGKNQDEILAIKNGGQADHSTPVNDEHLGIRPAMWIDLTNESVQDLVFAKGSVVTFGAYGEQGYSTKEKIKWLVLENDGDSALLLSENVIGYEKFNNERKKLIWPNAGIRTWLNNEFIRYAFSGDEQYSLVLANHTTGNVSGDNIQGYQQRKIEDCKDKVFLPSYKEITKYMKTKDERKAKPTKYAKAQGANGDFTPYWLLSPGKDDYGMAIINQNGDIDSKWVTDKWGVRPMIRVSLNFGMSDISRNANLSQ